LAGEGETQLEIQRRMILERQSKLKKDLEIILNNRSAMRNK
jgi:50S ribosomal subunit-associated GTPase HflX